MQQQQHRTVCVLASVGASGRHLRQTGKLKTGAQLTEQALTHTDNRGGRELDGNVPAHETRGIKGNERSQRGVGIAAAAVVVVLVLSVSMIPFSANLSGSFSVSFH